VIGIHNPWLFALSLGLALLAAASFVILAQQVARSRATESVPWIFAGGLAIGLALWTLHFVDRLAPRRAEPSWDELELMLIALVPAVAAAALALYAMSEPRRHARRAAAAIAWVASALAAPLLIEFDASAGALVSPAGLLLASASGLVLALPGLWLIPEERRSPLRSAAAIALLAGAAFAAHALTLPAPGPVAPQGGPLPLVRQWLAVGVSLDVALFAGLLVLASLNAGRLARQRGNLIGELKDTNRLLQQHALRIDHERARLTREDAQRYERLMQSANVGYFDWHIDTGRVEAGGCSASMLGYAPGRLGPAPEAWRELAHPQDLPLVERQVREHFNGERERVSVEVRLRDAGGGWRWVLLQGQVTEWSEDGRARRMMGTQTDIDEGKRAQSSLRAERRLFDSGVVIALAFDTEPPHALQLASSSLQEARAADGRPPPLGAPLAVLMHAGERDAIAASAARAIERPGAQQQCEVRLLREDGGSKWHLLHLVADAPGGDASLRAYLVDIHGLKQAESRAAEQSAGLTAVVQRMSSTQRFMESLQQVTELLQQSEGEAEAAPIVAAGARELFPQWAGALVVSGGETSSPLRARWGDYDEPAGAPEADCWAVRRRRLHLVNGERGVPVCGHLGGGPRLPDGIVHALCAPLSMSGERGGALHLIAREKLGEEEVRAASWGAKVFADTLTLALDNLQLRISLREQAVRDWLTGLYNRRHFDAVLRIELARAERTGDNITLALLDIDRFKSFNDAFGHEAGDLVLRAVAGQLMHFVRSYDIASRIGGEELAVLMPRARLEETCARLDRLRERIARLALAHDGERLPRVTVSIGVADLWDGANTDLLRRADRALYAAKHNGRNRLECWDATMRADNDREAAV